MNYVTPEKTEESNTHQGVRHTLEIFINDIGMVLATDLEHRGSGHQSLKRKPVKYELYAMTNPRLRNKVHLGKAFLKWDTLI